MHLSCLMPLQQSYLASEPPLAAMYLDKIQDLMPVVRDTVGQVRR